MSSSSPANSSISTTAVVGGSSGTTALEDFQIPTDLVPPNDRKDESLQLLKAELMDALNKEVKSLDEDNWKFEGPRSRINLISRRGSNSGAFFHKQMETMTSRNFPPPK